jgi:hypothetical protein
MLLAAGDLWIRQETEFLNRSRFSVFLPYSPVQSASRERFPSINGLKRSMPINLSGNNNESGAAIVAEAKAAADAEDAEEDDESGEDGLQLWLAALAPAEPTSEPVFRTIELGDNNDYPDEVGSHEDPAEAHNPDLAPLATTNITS